MFFHSVILHLDIKYFILSSVPQLQHYRYSRHPPASAKDGSAKRIRNDGFCLPSENFLFHISISKTDANRDYPQKRFWSPLRADQAIQQYFFAHQHLSPTRRNESSRRDCLQAEFETVICLQDSLNIFYDFLLCVQESNSVF